MSFEELDPAARRVNIETASFHNTGVHLGEAEKTRLAVLKTLDQTEGRRTPEQARILKRLEEQIDSAASVWTEKHPLRGPSKAQLIFGAKQWLSSLPGQTLDGLLAICPETARLVVVPSWKVSTLIKFIGGSIIGRSKSWNHVKAPTWRCAVTDGREDMFFDPSIFYENLDVPENKRRIRTNEAMLGEYARRFKANGLALMPQHGYVPAAAEALSRNQVLDRNCFTAFKRPAGSAFLPSGDFFHQVVLDENCHSPEGSNRGLRCRPWVEGKISWLKLV